MEGPQKTQKTIQKLAGIGRVLSRVVFVCSVVGGVLCAVAAVCAQGYLDVLRLGGVSIHGLLEDGIGLTGRDQAAMLLAWTLVMAAEAVVAAFAARYFRHEQAAGTPFTADGAREIRRLGILTIVLPVCAQMTGGIVEGILSITRTGSLETVYSSEGQVCLGILFLVASVIFRYGAELEQEIRNSV